VLLAALGTHLFLVVRSGSYQYPIALAAACALALAGCLWFVAARQISETAALPAVWLFVASPTVWHPGRSAATALVVFVLLSTAVGVGHALQGPARKWTPRFALLGVLTAALALLQPLLCALAIGLSGCALGYLAERKRARKLARKRVWIGPVLLGMAGVCAVAVWVRPALFGCMPRFFAMPVAAVHAAYWIGISVAGVAALGFWATSRRSRYFGHTAPLLAALALAALTPVLGEAAWTCALAPTLLFVAGVFADALQPPRGMRRATAQVLLAIACAVQAIALFLLT
jgi:hypothetical protein